VREQQQHHQPQHHQQLQQQRVRPMTSVLLRSYSVNGSGMAAAASSTASMTPSLQSSRNLLRHEMQSRHPTRL
jgi:hypothetical protein